MIVTLIAKEQLYTMTLPERVGGRYWVTDKDKHGHTRQIASVEGIDGHWILRGSALLALQNEKHQEVLSVSLKDGMQIINASYRKEGQTVQLLVEPSTEDRRSYKKYYVPGKCVLNIGRAGDNQIIFSSPYVSGHHARLILENGQWSITDTQSSNGTFVNGQRIATRQLANGDMIYMMGLKVIVGNGFFAMNNPDGCITLSADSVQELAGQKVEERQDWDEPKQECFYRSPRLYRGIVEGDIRVDAPPAPQKIEETPLALLIGPAVTMGMSAVVMGAVAILNLTSGKTDLISAMPTIIMSASMLCGTLLWPMLTKRSEKKKCEAEESRRQKKYREYLDEVKNDIYLLGQEQKDILQENSPTIQECVSRVINSDRKLWERTPNHEDFLCLRLGQGDVPINAQFNFPENRFSMEEDGLQNEIQRLKDLPKVLSDAPIICSLVKNSVVGIVGNRKETELFLQGLILQIAALHGYDDVKLAFLVDEGRRNEWKFTRLLPHVWNDAHDSRYWADCADEASALVHGLERIAFERREQNGNRVEPKPHYVVVVEDSQLAEKAGLYERVFADAEARGFSCLIVSDGLVSLPQECSMVIELGEEQATFYDRNALEGKKLAFRPEMAPVKGINQVAEVLGNLVVGTDGEKTELPDMVTFLEMFGLGKIEHLNARSRWRENNPVNSLRAPVGVGQDGSLFHLDLHEKVHGPHGLVAGMTGSGKSEFIITFILSMAVNYHPDEVGFILIDYKGGGLAGAFEDAAAGVKLPHLVGTITNLDGSAVNRALISIQSELRRRQAIFNEARQVSGEGTIDIYKYQKMYRGGLVSKPVPHLFIISDEFAELKAQQPEFMAQLISAARIGRSLGVHLILATQKPSGVVDDQIWSNSRFRVCLKVQERGDSMEMLKRPDAAELKETGRFYLQVGFNELFALGQSAWCGAPYLPSDSMEKKRNNSIAVVDDLGRVLIETKAKAKTSETKPTSQIVSIVKYLSDIAAEERIESERLWLPEIPSMIYVDELRAKYQWEEKPNELEAIIGEYDDPFNQAQGLLTIPFTREGNVLLYGVTGSGKTTMLNTMLVGMMSRYDATQLNVYIADLGEETLQAFEKAPQVGGVFLSSDEEEMRNLFIMLEKEVRRRKKLFAQSGGDFMSYCNEAEPVPQILVILRNYAAFYEQFEELDDILQHLTRDCAKYGIYFLVTANGASAVRYRVAQNFSQIFALQLNDHSDYISIYGSTEGVYPAKQKGRGIFRAERVFEFQAAHFAPDASQQAIRRFAQDLAEQSDVFAKRVPVLPETVTPEFFGSAVTAAAFPVGVEKVSLQPACLNLEQLVITPVLARDAGDLEHVVRAIAMQLEKLSAPVTVLDAAGILSEKTVNQSKAFAEAVENLFETMVYRNNSYKQDEQAGREPQKYEPAYCIMTDMKGLLEGLSDQNRDKLQTLLEKARLEYNVHFLLCDSTKNVSAYASAAWYKRQVDGGNGLWVGDGISEQYQLNIGKVTNDLYAELPEDFGYIVRKGKPKLTKLITDAQEGGQADE